MLESLVFWGPSQGNIGKVPTYLGTYGGGCG